MVEASIGRARQVHTLAWFAYLVAAGPAYCSVRQIDARGARGSAQYLPGLFEPATETVDRVRWEILG